MSEWNPMGDLPVIAAEQCTARSKSTGRQCGRQVRGGGVCHFHGGRAPQVAARREARIAVAEARVLFGDRYQPREWWEALPAAAQTADQLLQAMQDRLEMSGELRAADLEMVAQLAEKVARLSKLVQDANLDERRVKLGELQGQMIASAAQSFIARVIASLALDSMAEQVLRREFGAMLRGLSQGQTAIEGPIL